MSESSLGTLSLIFPLSSFLLYLGHPGEEDFHLHLPQAWVWFPSSWAWTMALAAGLLPAPPRPLPVCLLTHHSHAVRACSKAQSSSWQPMAKPLWLFLIASRKSLNKWTCYRKLFPVGLWSSWPWPYICVPDLNLTISESNIFSMFLRFVSSFPLGSLLTFSASETLTPPLRLRVFAFCVLFVCFCFGLNWIACKWALRRCWNWQTSLQCFALV